MSWNQSNRNRLFQILTDTTMQLRKGAEVEESKHGNLRVTHVFAMPHQDEITDPDIEKVDCVLVTIGVSKSKAEAHRDELIELLNHYPEPQRLAGGPSYIEVGAEIGSQGAAFQLFALGQVLGLWEVITPDKVGVTGEQATELARRGFVMMSGYQAKASQ